MKRGVCLFPAFPEFWHFLIQTLAITKNGDMHKSVNRCILFHRRTF